MSEIGIADIVNEQNLEKAWQTLPIGILVISQDTVIRYVNTKLEDLIGFRSSELVGKAAPYPWWPIEDQNEQRYRLESYMAQGLSSFEVMIRRKNGTNLWIKQSFNSLLSKNGFQYYLNSWIDIGKLKKMRLELQESEEKLRRFLKETNDGFSVWDSELNLVEVNKARMKMFTSVMNKKDIVGKNILELTPWIKESGWHDKYLQVLKTGLPCFSDNEVINYPGSMTKNLSLKIFKLGDKLWVVSSDITDAKRVENKLIAVSEELDKLYRRVIYLRREEREHLAHLVHSDIGQMLAVLKMELSWIRRNISQDKQKLLAKVESMAELLESTIEIARNISVKIREINLINLPLIDAVQWQINEFKETTHIKSKFIHTTKVITFDLKKNRLVLKILLEALINVFCHAHATKVTVKLFTKNDRLKLKVIDNGKGISKENIVDPNSIGIIEMSENASALHGLLNITGKLNEGTTIELDMPIW